VVEVYLVIDKLERDTETVELLSEVGVQVYMPHSHYTEFFFALPSNLKDRLVMGHLENAEHKTSCSST
jgi:hypothetical protein